MSIRRRLQISLQDDYGGRFRGPCLCGWGGHEGKTRAGSQSREPKEERGYRMRRTGRTVSGLLGTARVRLRATVGAVSVAPDRGADPSCWWCQPRAECGGGVGKITLQSDCFSAAGLVSLGVRPGKCFMDRCFACGRPRSTVAMSRVSPIGS